jgi:hypothetical protein
MVLMVVLMLMVLFAGCCWSGRPHATSLPSLAVTKALET